MITTNPFSLLSETIPSIALQAFVLVMVGLVAAGTILDIIHKKNDSNTVKHCTEAVTL